MANCVLSTSIPIRVGGIFVNAPANHSDIAPPANPNLSMEQCRESCGMVGSCEPVGFHRVRRETFENPLGGIKVPSTLKNALDLTEDQCLDQCKLNKNCKAIIHDNTDGNSCFHLSNVSNHRTLESGNAQLFIRD